jgi:hypothetical protein
MIKGIISRILLLLFLLTNFIIFVFAVQTINFDYLPINVGRIVDSYNGQTNTKIVLVKDLHCVPFAQKNIYNIISVLKNKYKQKCRVIGIEGTPFCKLDTKILSTIPDADVRLSVLKSLSKDGIINGAEMYAAMYPKEFSLYGTENLNEYISNFYSFCDGVKYVKSIETLNQDLMNVMQHAETYIYPREVIELEKLKIDFLNKNISFSEYMKRLELFLKQYELNIQDYSTVFKYIKFLYLKNHINTNLVYIEACSLLRLIEPHLSKDEFRKLDIAKQSNSEDFYFMLKKYFDMFCSSNFNALNDYFVYLEYKYACDKLVFLEELDRLEYDLKRKILANQEDALDILESEWYLNLLSAYVSNNANIFDAQEWMDKRNAIFDKLKNMNDMLIKYNYIDEKLKILKNADSLMTNFYVLADKRSETIVDNLLNIKKGNVKILVAGGYHSHRITQYLKSRGISYDVIEPVVGENYNKEIYFSRLKKQKELLNLKNVHDENTYASTDKLMLMSHLYLMHKDTFSDELKNKIIESLLDIYTKKDQLSRLIYYLKKNKLEFNLSQDELFIKVNKTIQDDVVVERVINGLKMIVSVPVDVSRFKATMNLLELARIEQEMNRVHSVELHSPIQNYKLIKFLICLIDF